MEDNVKNHTKLYIFATVVVIIIFLGGIGYRIGYRFQNNFLIGKVGNVRMEIPLINTKIFVDEEKEIITKKDNESVDITLSPRSHSIIVSRDGYFPWKKDFVLPSNGKLTLSPIFITQNATGEIITQRDPEYWKIRNEVQQNVLPTKNSPYVSTTTGERLWLDDNAIITEIGSTTNTVIQPDDIVKNLFFYKNRTDAVLFSMNDTIYMIETSKFGTQNFIPIYKGKDPYFIETDPNFIYVLDGENLMQVVI